MMPMAGTLFFMRRAFNRKDRQLGKRIIAMKNLCLHFCLGLFVALLFGSCESQVFNGGSVNSAGAARFAQAPPDRPGLGTKWGETRTSRVDWTTFHRADPVHPFATAAIYYNDEAGIRAMAGAVAWHRVWPFLPAPTERLISIGLKDQSGRFLPGLIVGDRWFVVGEEGRRYSIAVRNRTDLRLEVVLSVDG